MSNSQAGRPATPRSELASLSAEKIHWATPHIGKPWLLGADGPDAYDCWGLVRAVYLAQLGVVIAPAGFASEEPRRLIEGIAAYPAWSEWRQIDAPTEFDAVLMAQARHPVHVGLWLSIGAGRVLHTTRAGGVIVQDKRSLVQTGFAISGFYRHASQ